MSHILQFAKKEEMSSITKTSARTASLAALALGASLLLAACGGDSSNSQNIEGNGAEVQSAEAQVQTFYQVDDFGPQRQLVLDGTSVAVYSFICEGGTAKLNTDFGWRGTMTADSSQIMWTSGETGTDDVAFASDGSSITLQSQQWPQMDEQEALDAQKCD